MNRAGHASNGFTLIEMLITVSVASLLLAIAVPSFESLISQSSLMSSTDDLTSSIRVARSEAIKRGERSAICPSARPLESSPSCDRSVSWAAGWIVFIDGNENGARDTSEEVIVQMGKRPPALSMEIDSILGDSLVFSVAGHSIGVNGTPRSGSIRLSYQNAEERSVTLQANGRVRVTEVASQ